MEKRPFALNTACRRVYDRIDTVPYGSRRGSTMRKSRVTKSQPPRSPPKRVGRGRRHPEIRLDKRALRVPPERLPAYRP